ncbi:hypothetical protein CH76_07285 [Lysinibacillus sp. BF-4]|uniref:methyl-accepting chemotaxis protein n=1 Tax=Lysinibacillus sp. BF-4 TaxID=1473546 RepID=UPI000504BA65|nr:methyl-accepting chemotaxis protein [Lysinibacillus sp. BF-4]KFL43343.1 hypothetical protein CH76_07285 [Lysinibacillus sp. BF-4]
MFSSIKAKLMTAFSILIVLTIIIGAIGFNTARTIDNNYTELLEHDVEQVNIINELLILQGRIVGDVRAYMLYENPEYVTKIGTTQDEFSATLQKLEAMVGKQYAKQVATIATAATDYRTITKDIITNFKNNKLSKDQLALGTKTNAMIFDESHALKKAIQDDLTMHNEELNGLTTQALWLIAIALLIVIVAGVIITYVANRSISPPIIATTEVMHKMAKGDLSMPALPIKGKDEVSKMATSLNELLTRWNIVVQKMGQSSTDLAAQSEQLSASSEESLASSEMVAQAAESNMANSESQASHILQSIDSLTEVGEGINQIATSNEEMLHAATGMRSLVHDGVNVVREVSDHMTAIDTTIGESTQIMEIMAQRAVEIEEVSAMITGISEQTNLLALNAAIEAARAGENGKGFAVVADEVRKLAEESRQSAARIETMIQDVRQAAEQAVQSIQSGQTKVAEGLARSAASLDVFTTIEGSVDDVNGRVETVSAAVQQIQAMSSEVLRSSTYLQELAEQSSSSAQDTGAATEEQLAAMQEISASTQALADLAQHLQDEVNHFTLR